MRGIAGRCSNARDGNSEHLGCRRFAVRSRGQDECPSQTGLPLGLGLIDAIAGLDAKSVKLQSRVGFVTALVVVGDLIGEGSAREQSTPLMQRRSAVGGMVVA